LLPGSPAFLGCTEYKAHGNGQRADGALEEELIFQILFLFAVGFAGDILPE
jgi:hypothetical protein